VETNNGSILVVEDESIIALDLRYTLTNMGYQVVGVVAGGRDAIDKAGTLRPDLVLMDIHLEDDIDGIEAAEDIRDRFGIPIVYLTAYADPATLKRARVTDPFGYLLKPYRKRELQVTIELALYRDRMERRLLEKERWLSAVLRSIGDGVVATDADWRVSFINPVAERITGWTSSEAIGHELFDVLPVSKSVLQSSFPDAGFAPNGGNAEGVLLCRTGAEVQIHETSTTIRDDNSRVIGSVIAFRRISDGGI
jgi:two-component system, cell cycle sensor histidine kinase and response regulator CckA